jgi:hypothetical protein
MTDTPEPGAPAPEASIHVAQRALASPSWSLSSLSRASC